jgi:hypothetical protein
MTFWAETIERLLRRDSRSTLTVDALAKDLAFRGQVSFS